MRMRHGGTRGTRRGGRGVMLVTIETIKESRDCLVQIVNLLGRIGRQRGHDTQSCACDICLPSRELARNVYRLGTEIANQRDT